MKRNANRHNRFLNFGLAAQAAILALVLLSVSFLPRVIFAATFTVAPDSEYQTIQSAIGASSNGDTVLVAPGVYRENVAFGGRIILKAENAAPGATVIEAVDPAVSAITAAGPAEINGFTIRGATNSAGIRLNYGAWEAKISNNIIESNLDGIYIVNYGSGNSEITRNIFRDNTGYDINLPAEYNSSAGVSTQSSGNIIYLNDFYGTLYPYQDYVNYWNSQEELGYKYQNKVYRGKPGNYQPQCQTEDPDGDGIGNAACPIGGYTDGFPLVQPFANYEIAESEIISGQQEWDQNKIIDNPVVINAGARLTIKKGVKITFQNNGSILVNGDLLAKGTVKNPIVFNGMNGYAGRIITVGESGKADFRNAEISTSAIDGGLPPRQTAVSVSGAGILEMQACNINGNAAGIELNRVNGGNIKINRSKFFNNINDVANNDPADAVLPDFKWNWWGDSKINRRYGSCRFRNWVAEESFRDPVVVVPGILVRGEGWQI